MSFVKRLRVFMFLSCIAVPAAHAACTNLKFVDPIDDVDWDCVFPIAIAGIPFDYGTHPPDEDTDYEMECECPGKYYPDDPGIGFLVDFWEPAMIVDTVADPWCFPAIGENMSSDSTAYDTSAIGYNGSGHLSHLQSHSSYRHFHYYIFPVWGILGLFSDVDCIGNETDMALEMVSEVRADWGDDMLAMELYPESSVMGNVAVVMACMADAVASTVQEPIDALYWCMGSWGTTYPMTGHTVTEDHVEAAAADAGKTLYLEARWGELPDRVEDYCESTPIPIWIKSHYRLQELDPVTETECHSIGEPGMLWTQHKNPPGLSDNFSWLVFRRVHCCVVVF